MADQDKRGVYRLKRLWRECLSADSTACLDPWMKFWMRGRSKGSKQIPAVPDLTGVLARSVRLPPDSLAKDAK